MKVLVTGAAGFIGSTLAHQLLDRGDEVVGIDNLTTTTTSGSSRRASSACVRVPGSSFTSSTSSSAGRWASFSPPANSVQSCI